MRSNSAAKSPATKRKAASSSTKSKRSAALPKSDLSSHNEPASNELDGLVDRSQAATVESEAGDRILEETGADIGASGAVVSEPELKEEVRWKSEEGRRRKEEGTFTEITAITLHQPWASLIAAGYKQYETRSWATDYRGSIAIHAGKKFEEDSLLLDLLGISASEVPRGAIIAIAELVDCIQMDAAFISGKSDIELMCGDWSFGRYAWKLENVRAIEPISATGKQGLWKWNPGSWNPADFGELHHVAEENGQLNLLDWTENEPPEPDDYSSIELFDEAYKQWQQSTVNSQQSAVNSKELVCNQLMDGSTFAAESVQASPMPELNYGEEAPTSSASGTTTAKQFLDGDSQMAIDTAMLKPWTLGEANLKESNLLAPALPANPSQLMENDSEQPTIETAFPMSSEQSEKFNPNSQLLKMSEDSSPVPIPPATNQEVTSATSSTPYSRAGTMQNGKLSAAPTLPPLGVEKELLLLRSPGALSTTKGRPPGKTRLESQLHQLGLIQDGEVVAPEFLELGYNLPVGWTNLQENRTALELSQPQAQQSSIAHKSELPAKTAITAIEGKPSETPLTGGLQPLDSAELIISASLPPNMGALTKSELLSLAQEQHQLIYGIERKQSELALEKLHRIYVTGVCLVEFKKKCQYGEFIEQIESRGISARSAQQYTFVAKNWETIEAKAKLVSLLPEESQPAIGLKWALETVRDEKKHLKSAAPPKDPDGWRTPDTKDQPVVSLVKKSLGGSIWLDPCSGSSSNIPAAVRYYKQDDGLAHHQTWSKTVFINPPFSDPFPWVERCCLEFARGNVSAAVMLLKAGTVSNMGTGELINKYASAICHWRGRINFLNDEGNAVKGSDFDCVFVYFGARLDLFRQAFQQRGTIATIDNHYSSVNKKFLEAAPLPEPQTLKSEQKQLAAAVGLGNGRSVLPDLRDFDRELAERYDPHTVTDHIFSMPTSTPAKAPTVSNSEFQSIAEPETFDETPLAVRQFEVAKQNTLNDYITAISSNLSDFSDDQIAFLAKIVSEESAKRIGF